MSHILVCATPAPGHVNPMLAIASELAECGYEITFTTSNVFGREVEAAGLRFVPLRGRANYDYRALQGPLEERQRVPAGVPRLIHDLKHVFVDMIPDQHRTLQSVVESSLVDLILTETAFLGTVPLLLDPARERPPVVSCGVTPLFIVTSRDRPPVGAPTRLRKEKRDYLAEHHAFQAALQPADEYLEKTLADMQVAAAGAFIMDAMHTLPDIYLQLTGDSFEFPCSDLPHKIRFVGPVLPKASTGFEEPEWWSTLDSGRPVILVTQGTVANVDLTELIEPSLQALANEDVTVIAALGSTGPRPLSIRIPKNARLVPFVPFNRLMAKISVFITNGGYGAVNQALQHAVPVIVAGSTEDKPFVAARVAWTGSGIDLETEHPTPNQIRSAVRRILVKDSFRRNARRVSENFRRYHPSQQIATEIERQISMALQRKVLEPAYA